MKRTFLTICVIGIFALPVIGQTQQNPSTLTMILDAISKSEISKDLQNLTKQIPDVIIQVDSIYKDTKRVMTPTVDSLTSIVNEAYTILRQDFSNAAKQQSKK